MSLSLAEIEQRILLADPADTHLERLEEIHAESPEVSVERGRSAALIGSALYHQRRDDEAVKYYEECQDIAGRLGNSRLLSDAIYGFAVVAFRNADYKACTMFVEEALSLAVAERYHFRMAACYGMLGHVARAYGAHEATIDNISRALQLAREFGFVRFEGNCLSNLIDVSKLSNNFKAARSYTEAYLKIAEKGSLRDRLSGKLQLVSIDLELQQQNEAKAVLESAMTDAARLADDSLSSLAHRLKARILAIEKNWEEAEKAYESALLCTTYRGSEKVRSNLHAAIASFNLQRKLPHLALEHAKKSLETADKAGFRLLRKDAFQQLSNAYKALGDYENAFKYLEEYNKLIAESDNKLLESRLEFHELRYNYEAEQAKAEERQRQAELLRIELERKDTELVEKTRHLIKQTESLEQFRSDLKAIIRKLPSSDPMVQEVRTRLKELPEEQLHWQDFDSQFNSIHPEFLHNLTKAFPELTPTERKICPLLKLNLETPDIAKLLFVSERNVENHRYRIRKKLGLAKGENLGDFFAKY